MNLREKKTSKYNRLEGSLANPNLRKAETRENSELEAENSDLDDGESDLDAEKLDTEGAEMEDEELDADLEKAAQLAAFSDWLVNLDSSIPILEEAVTKSK